jgi:hypothetical protein
VDEDPADKQHALQEASRALIAASEQIALALQESQPQVEALGEALQKLAAALTASGSSAPAALRAEMQRAVMRLQFYDRMTQHLTHVQDYLARSAGQIEQAEEIAVGWTGVHQQLSERLLTETQRLHLGRNFPEGAQARREAPVRETKTGAGEIDLF